MLSSSSRSWSNILGRCMPAVWLAAGAVWIYWRASRDSNFAVTHVPWPGYHLWFLFVTGVLVATGVVLASSRTTSGGTGWKGFVLTVLIGTACLALAGFEIIDMVHGCRLTYEGIFVP